MSYGTDMTVRAGREGVLDASRGGVTACAGARVAWFKVCISKTDNKSGSSECGCECVQQSKKSTESRIIVRFPAL